MVFIFESKITNFKISTNSLENTLWNSSELKLENLDIGKYTYINCFSSFRPLNFLKALKLENRCYND